MPNKFLTIGGATVDLTFYTKEGFLVENKKNLTAQKLLGFEFGAKINVPEMATSFGGGAANAAICLARLGEKTSVFIAVGADDWGRGILKKLQKEKVNVKFAGKSEKNSGLSALLTHNYQGGEDHVLFTFRGANEDLKIEARAYEQIKPDWVYLSSLSGKGWQVALTKIFGLRAKEDNYLAWNPGNLQLKSGLKALKLFLQKTDVLILNKDEAIELLVPEIKGAVNPRKLLALLRNYCPGILVITDGIGGAYAMRDREIFFEPVKNVRKKDTVGVGDAFGATFVWGLNQFGGDLEKALKAAMINAASVVTEAGAQKGLLRKAELLREI